MDWNVLRFFFDFRGGKGINNSFEGLLRSLLLQLINAIPQPKQLSSDEKKNYPQSDWPEHKLRDALRRLLNNAKQGVCIFVDGLDEYEGNVLQLIQFLRSLATSKDSKSLLTKICVSSRPEPIPAQLLQHLPNLSISDHNEPGIESYSRLTLEGLGYEVLEDLDVPRLSLIVSQRAEGVFLWARFALEELIQGYCNGDKFQELLARLESIPRDLEEIYDRMLSRMEPNSKRECMIMLQLVCFAKRSLSWQELLVATETAMNKDVFLSEPICGDADSVVAPELYKSFTRRLRAKAAGLLELVDEEAKLIHKCVSTYLNQRGWQTLGGSEGENMVEHQSMYVQTCTRYLHRLLRHCKLEKFTGEYLNISNGLDRSTELNRELCRSLRTYPFFTYAAGYIIEHAKSLERHGTSSYSLLHGCLTEQLVCLHFIFAVVGAGWCEPCEEAYWRSLVEGFDAIYVAFSHGLVSYCKDELATRSPAPGQPFWARALRLALFSMASRDVRYTFGSQEVVSLALQNITTVQQSHLEQAFFNSLFPMPYEAVDLMLQHESVKTLRLVDSNGQAITLLWMFTRFYEGHRWDEWGDYNMSEKFLSLLIKTASNRGEDVRQRCGPEGNVVETLLNKSPTPTRSKKLLLLREHYESMSWPFPYDVGEIEREG